MYFKGRKDFSYENIFIDNKTIFNKIKEINSYLNKLKTDESIKPKINEILKKFT